MALAPAVERRHVLEAMERIRAEGVPGRARSTRFDVLHPDRTPFPPKLVLSVATELATGEALPRTDFSGGEETNAPLRELGFEVVEKDAGSVGTTGRDAPEPGEEISNDELTRMFEVGNAGGMRWSGRRGCLVMVADHTKALYDDRWEGDVLHYTGTGANGDQELRGANARLAAQRETGAPVHLFEVFRPGRYVYAGQVALAGDPRIERQLDYAGQERRVYVFPLQLEEGGRRPLPDRRDLDEIEEARARRLSLLSAEDLAQRAALGGREKPAAREARTTRFDRDIAVAELARRLAEGRCDLCGEQAPFQVRGVPYLECHHVEHLANGGADTIANAVALCPNCHRRMHALDHAADRKRLRERIARRILPSFRNHD